MRLVISRARVFHAVHPLSCTCAVIDGNEEISSKRGLKFYFSLCMNGWFAVEILILQEYYCDIIFSIMVSLKLLEKRSKNYIEFIVN